MGPFARMVSNRVSIACEKSELNFIKTMYDGNV